MPCAEKKDIWCKESPFLSDQIRRVLSRPQSQERLPLGNGWSISRINSEERGDQSISYSGCAETLWPGKYETQQGPKEEEGVCCTEKEQNGGDESWAGRRILSPQTFGN